jgi:hypothetical protein
MYNKTLSTKHWLLSVISMKFVLLTSLVIFIIILLSTWQTKPSPHVDNIYYLKIAQGFSVIYPFSKRILYPYITLILKVVTGLPLEQSFLLANTLNLFIFLFTVTFLLNKFTSTPLLSLLLLFNPLVIRSFREAIMPDLFFATLLSVFFICIYYSLLWQSLVMLFLLYFTRDNALFVCLALFLAAWWQSRLKWVFGSLLALLVANILLSMATGGRGSENLYQISNLLYMILRIPKNLLYNVFGILIWNNIHPTVGIPAIKIAIPGWLPLGALHSLGLCPWEPTIPLRTITLVLTTFGILPMLLAFILIKNYQVIKTTSLGILVAVIYGCMSFVAGVMISLDVGRQLGYAWPAFWLAVPALYKQHYQIPKPVFYRIAFYQIALCWAPWVLTPWLVTRYQDIVPTSISYVLFMALLLHLLALRELLTLPCWKPASKSELPLNY